MAWRFGALLLSLAGSAAAHDWLIVPGERVGPVTARSTEAELRRAFGGPAVARAQIRIDEKTAAPGVEIYRGRAGESLAVVWPRKEGRLSWPMLVLRRYGSAAQDCRWRTAAGVRVGLGLQELEKLNGKAFLLFPSINPKAWTDAWWDGGRLETDLGQDVELSLTRGPDEPDYNEETYHRTDEKRLKRPDLRLDRMADYLLSGKKPAPITDWTIGGPAWEVATSERVEAMRETLGADQVKRIRSQADEGAGDLPGVSAFGDQPDRMIELRRGWGSTTCGSFPGYKDCRWRMTGGLSLSMSLERVAQLNGGPFEFNGFEWDLGGIVRTAPVIERKWPALRMVVTCEGDVPERMYGDKTLRSDDPELKKLQCTVYVVL